VSPTADGHRALTLRLEGDVVELLPPAVAAALARALLFFSPLNGMAPPSGNLVDDKIRASSLPLLLTQIERGQLPELCSTRRRRPSPPTLSPYLLRFSYGRSVTVMWKKSPSLFRLSMMSVMIPSAET
jgi:hypothetical protein